MKDNKKSYKKS